MFIADADIATTQIADALSKCGLDVRVYSNLAEAFVSAAVQRPDVLLAFWNADGGSNGRSIIRQMRHSNRCLKEIPAILISDRSVDNWTERKLSLEGAWWIIRKPTVFNNILEWFFGELLTARRKHLATLRLIRQQHDSPAFETALGNRRAAAWSMADLLQTA